MNDGKKGSAAITSGLRPITSPHAKARPTLSERARRLGLQPISVSYTHLTLPTKRIV